MNIRHGTLLGYASDKCKCSDCKAAYARYRYEIRHSLREVKKQAPVKAKEPPRVSMGICKNCGLQITYGRYGQRWVHGLTRTAFCFSTGSTTAELGEIFYEEWQA